MSTIPDRVTSGKFRYPQMILGKEGFFNININDIEPADITFPAAFLGQVSVKFDHTVIGKNEKPPIVIGVCHELNDAVPQSLLMDDGTSVRISSLPVKKSGSYELSVPKSLQIMIPFIRQCLAVERQLMQQKGHETFRDMWAHLTFERANLRAGESLKGTGPHIDGVQGKRYVKKLPISRHYVASSKLGTRFFPSNFPGGKYADPEKYNIMSFLNEVVDMESYIDTDENVIYLYDGYTVHEGRAADRNLERTFFKLVMWPTAFDREGNSINLHIPVQQQIRKLDPEITPFPQVLPRDS